MSARVLAFGPWSVAWDGPEPSELLAPFEARREAPDATIVAHLDPSARCGADDATSWTPTAEGGTLRGPDFEARVAGDGARVEARLATADVGGMALLAALVARVAARRDAFALHAAGRVLPGGGVALLAGPPGAGKSTWARAAGTAVFAHNGVWVEPRSRTCWPLPFTGRDDPPLHDARPRPLDRLLVAGGDERRGGGAHPTDVLPHVVTVAGDAESVRALGAALALANALGVEAWPFDRAGALR